MKQKNGSGLGQPEVYLVTGGAGMLGRSIVSQLMQRGKTVRVLDIEPTADDGAEMIAGDVRDAEIVRKACKGVDSVIHAAAAVWNPELSSTIYYDTNVVGTQLIIDTCIEFGIPRLVYTSTMDVVMDGKQDHLLADESMPYPADYTKMDKYAYSKMLAEQAVIKANGQALSTCALRPAGMYGPGDQYHVTNIIKNAKHGINIRLGNGRAQFSHVFSGNVAYAHILAAEHLAPDSPVAGQAYFVTDHDTGNFFDFMNPYLEQMGIPVPKISIPHRPANILAWFAERLSPKSNFNRYSIYCTCVDHTFVHDKATRDFGYKPIFSTEEAFDITLEWLKTQQF